MKLANLNIHGIKCDNPNCDYRNNEVNFDDYKDWVNKPCPICGDNLLTEVDFINSKILIEATSFINDKVGEIPDDSPIFNTEIKMDGSGKMEFGEPKFASGNTITKEELDKSIKETLGNITPNDFKALLNNIINISVNKEEE